MAMGNTAESASMTQDMSDFEAEFGLQGNEPPASLEDGHVDEDAILSATDSLLEMDEDSDNIARLDRMAAAEARADTGEADDAEEDEDEYEAAESQDAPADEEEEAEEDGAEEEDEEGDEAEVTPLGETIAKMPPEKAQAILDKLLEVHGSSLKVRYRANGEDVEATFAELRDRAAGYAGQSEVDRARHQVQQERQQVEQMFVDLKQIYDKVQQDRQILLNYVQQDPQAFVRDVLMQYSTPDYMRSLRDQLDVTIDQIERDPYAFEQGRKLQQMEQMLQQLLNGGGQARHGNPLPHEQQTLEQHEAGLPEDFGFIPGQGYPRQYSTLAFRALQTASKAVGIDVDEVLDVWEAEGKREPADAVLARMVRQRFAETEKVQAAQKRKGRKRAKAKKGGIRVPQKNESARKTLRWDDIEGELAREVQRLSESGAL